MSDPYGPVVPAYFHPARAAADWAALAGVAPSLRLVVLNVANGAGPAPDHAFVDVIREAQRAGAVFAGYVDSDYGRVGAEQIVIQQHRYQAWYGVHDVFLDRAAAGVEHVSRYERIARACRSAGASTVAFNHGTHPAPEYAWHADLLGTFEGALPAYLDLHVPRWVHDVPPTRLFHLLYDTPAQVAGRMVDLAEERNVGSLYRTERKLPNPWSGLPADFLTVPAGWPT